MFDRFTAAARRSLFVARYRTAERNGDAVSAEDLLYGVSLADPDAIELLGERAAAAIRSSESVEQCVARMQYDPEVSLRAQNEIPFSQEAWGAIQFAIGEADALVHRDIGGQHLLLGLLRDETTNTYRSLSEAGVQLPDLRLQVKAQHDRGPAA